MKWNYFRHCVINDKKQAADRKPITVIGQMYLNNILRTPSGQLRNNRGPLSTLITQQDQRHRNSSTYPVYFWIMYRATWNSADREFSTDFKPIKIKVSALEKQSAKFYRFWIWNTSENCRTKSADRSGYLASLTTAVTWSLTPSWLVPTTGLNITPVSPLACAFVRKRSVESRLEDFSCKKIYQCLSRCRR